MARWRLTASHYLNTVKPTEYEVMEEDPENGGQMRTRLVVPRFFDVEDRTRLQGNTVTTRGRSYIVCWQGTGERGDIEFIGQPTPDMEPLDDEAAEVSASLREKWETAARSEAGIPNQNTGDTSLAIQAEALRAAMTPAPVQIEGLDQLIGAITQQAMAIQSLLAAAAK